MARGYFCNDVTGVCVYYGERTDRTDLEAGNVFVPTTNPMPEPNEDYVWDLASAWVVDAARRQARLDRESRRATDQATRASLRSVVEGGGPLTGDQVRQALEAMLGAKK